jgi:acetyltransferase EpsM
VRKLEDVAPYPDGLFVVAVGDTAGRRDLATRAAARGCRFVTLIHPLAYVAGTAELGEGRIVSPFAFVGPAARLGDHVALNVHATVDHDGSVGGFSYLAPYACVGGGARVGERAAVGVHASLAPGAVVRPGERVAPGTHVAKP